MFDVWETMKFRLGLQLQHGFTCKLNQIYLHRNGNFEHVMNNRVKESPSMSGKGVLWWYPLKIKAMKSPKTKADAMNKDGW